MSSPSGHTSPAAPTALDRARAFASRTALNSALVIVPLAAATSAQAAPVFDTAGASMVSAGCSGTPLLSTANFQPAANGGVKFFGDAQWEWSSSGGGGTSCGFDLIGTGSGTLDTATMGGHHDFNANITDVSFGVPKIDGWKIEYFINEILVGSAGQIELNTGSISPADDLILSGWTINDVLNSWKVSLRVDVIDDGAGLLSINVPNNSIAFLPLAPTAVPEPGSALLVGAALAGLVGFSAKLRVRREPRGCGPRRA